MWFIRFFSPMLHMRQKIVKYLLVFLFFVWLLLGGYLYYKYIISSSETVPARWGTLVEWVTTNISYLPYVGNNDGDIFYQGLLYQACMGYFSSGYQIIYEPEMCKVITQDNKTYLVSLNTTGTWSDTTPITIDDVLFTYQDIIKNNFWDIPNLRNYNKIDVEKISDNSLRVTFPWASVDNFNFFTNYILPKHRLKGVALNYYLHDFKQQPITNNCGTIKSWSADESSLVFDVGGCDRTWIRYYQVKKIDSPEKLATSNLVDLTVSATPIEGYKDNKLIENKYVWLFFNMQRGRLSIYGRKNFIALVNHHLFLDDNNPGIIKENFLFDAFPKAVTDKSAIIAAVAQNTVWSTGSENPVNLPDVVTIDSPGEKREFIVAESTWNIVLSVKSTKPYDSLEINANDDLQADVVSSTNSIKLTLIPEENLFEGINTYVVQGLGKASDETVATIVLYYKTPYVISKNAALKVVYYSGDPFTINLIKKIRMFLSREGLAGYFDFQGMSSPENFEGKLASKDYDITVRGIDLWLKKDISNLLLTDNPIINPSLYINSNLASQINQFFATNGIGNQNSIKREIDRLYLNDLPFALLGKTYTLLHSKPYIFIDPNTVFYESDYRRKILHNVVLGTRPLIKKATVFNMRGFFSFVLKTLANR